MKKNKWWVLLALLLALSLVLVACGGDADDEEAAADDTQVTEDVEDMDAVEEDTTTEDTTAEDTTADESEMAEVSFAYPAGGALEQALTGAFDGTQVTVDGPIAGDEVAKLDASVAPFEEATGIDVVYVGSQEFETSISVRVGAGDAPDIADFPQPGLIARFARQGDLVPLDFISDDWIAQQYGEAWFPYMYLEGADGEEGLYGLVHRYNAKSLVWYPIDDFEAAGYEVPQTWDELMALTEQIASDGDAPWCIGIGSGTATGWPATDWTEEMMLRTASPEDYDAWVAGELPFDSPQVREAINTWSEIWFNDDYVLGGTDAIVTTEFGDSIVPMFDDPPRCWLHKQGNFIVDWIPEGNVYGEDYGIFYLPPVDPQYGSPWLGGGDIMGMFNDRPEVRALMEYFTVPESAGGWLQGGGALAAHQTATPDMYGNALEGEIAQLVTNADTFRFDGSDLMPSEVGAGTFWTGMVDYVSGAATLDEVLPEIDASWPD